MPFLYDFLYDLREEIWWSMIPGVKIKLPWPTEHMMTVRASYVSWLEDNVGKRYWTWNWSPLDDDGHMDLLTIKFRRDKAELATEMKLRFG